MENRKERLKKLPVALMTAFLFIIGLSSPTFADAVTDWNAIGVQSVVAAGAARPGASGARDLTTHFRFADEPARTQGRKVANYGHKYFLKPVRGGGDGLSRL